MLQANLLLVPASLSLSLHPPRAVFRWGKLEDDSINVCGLPVGMRERREMGYSTSQRRKELLRNLQIPLYHAKWEWSVNKCTNAVRERRYWSKPVFYFRDKFSVHVLYAKRKPFTARGGGCDPDSESLSKCHQQLHRGGSECCARMHTHTHTHTPK